MNRLPSLPFVAPILALTLACTSSPDATETPGSPATTPAESVTSTATATATPWPTATVEPTPEERCATAEELNALPPHTRLGEPAFDAIVDAVIAGDVDTVMDAVAWEDRECAVNWSDGPPSPPRCLGDEAEGTAVPSLLVIRGEGSYLRPEDVRDVLDRAFAESRDLCELLRLEDGSRVVVLRSALLSTVVERGETTDAALVSNLSARVIDGAVIQLGDNAEALLQSQIRCRGIFDIQ